MAAQFAESAKLKLDSSQALVAPLVRAGSLMAEALRAGGKVLIHPSPPENLKVTTRFDLRVAELLLADRG